ncbi:hypothetical protein DBR00_04270 [Pseudomonas sp. HMWF032]|nr:hypothetical protein DBR00_04270 [Pseudomonas sp. HMWF032]PTT81947.1 hypothetical protein DBR41_15605 [Pseudomonas sp. HMWF010]
MVINPAKAIQVTRAQARVLCGQRAVGAYVEPASGPRQTQVRIYRAGALPGAGSALAWLGYKVRLDRAGER